MRLAQTSGRFDQGVEYGPQIERRTADGLQHIGRRCLLLQRVTQLIEQPRVLDGNNGLGGKVLDQLNLLIGEAIESDIVARS